MDLEPWLNGIRAEHRDVAARLIELIRQAGPEFEEAIKWKTPCFSAGGALRCFVADYPKHVHLGFFNGASIKSNSDLLEGSGKQMRHVKVVELNDELERRLTEMVRESASLPADASG